MKKFLTVLLVIAVMFTFSFGSAFAATQEQFADSYSTVISDQWFETLWEELVTVTGTNDTVAMSTDVEAWYIDKAVLAGLKTEAKATYDYYMQNVATDYITSVDDLKHVVFEYCHQGGTDKQKAFKLAVAAAQFAADKAKVIAAFDSVATYDYSTEAMPDSVAPAITGLTLAGKGYTYKEAAEKIVNFYKSKVEAKDDFNADVTVRNYYTASNDVKGIQTDALLPLAYVDGANVFKTGAYDLKVAYGTVSTEYIAIGTNVNKWSTTYVDTMNKTNAATVAAVKAQNAAKYAAYVAAHPTDVKYADKWLKVADILAEEGYTYNGTGTKDIVDPNGTTQAYVSRADKMAELEEAAAKLAAEKNADGQYVRDAAEVQKLLKKGITAIATATVSDVNAAYTTAYNNILNAKSAAVAARLEFVKESAKNAIEALVADFEDDEVFYAKELATVKGYADKYAAAIDAATTETAAKDAYKTFAEKVAAENTAKELDDTWTGRMASTGSEKAVYDAAVAYVNYYNPSVGGDTASAALVKDVLKARLAEMIGESGYRTQAEIKTLKEKAVEVAKALPTNSDVKAAKKAVKDAIAALPAKATVADFALVQAVSDALDAYEEVKGTTTVDGVSITPYTTAVTQIVNEYNADFGKKVATIDKTDEDAVNALVKEIKAARLDIKYLTNGNGSVTYMETLRDRLYGYLKEIQATEKKAVEKAIAAIPLTVSEADKATVEAARKLYDAYVEKYKDMDSVYYATDIYFTASGTHAADTAEIGAGAYNDGIDIDITALEKAEVVLGLNAPDPEENAKAYVQDLSIKARSEKTSKGVKVTIKADVQQLLDDGFTVEYRFYRSTKSNKNFGKPMIVKSTNTYTNTKGVKGTRYYYKAKIVVKNAAGEVVATTPLTQCLYATRVF